MRTVKRILLCVLALGLLAGIACKKNDGNLRDTLAGKTFVWEKEGCGGDFTITLNADGTYQYYEGFLSSYIGVGTWTVENDTVILTEQGGQDAVYRFTVKDGALVYAADGSDRFLYVDVQNGDRFAPAE